MTTISMEQAKFEGLAAAGKSFVSPKGVTGTVLPTKSAHGKVQAEFTCNSPGCCNTHIREQSDWHQSQFCLNHSKTKTQKKGVAVKEITLQDGTKIQRQVILDTDDQELKDLKAQVNEAFDIEMARIQKEALKSTLENQKSALTNLLSKIAA